MVKGANAREANRKAIQTEGAEVEWKMAVQGWQTSRMMKDVERLFSGSEKMAAFWCVCGLKE